MQLLFCIWSLRSVALLSVYFLPQGLNQIQITKKVNHDIMRYSHNCITSVNHEYAILDVTFAMFMLRRGKIDI